MGSQYYYQKLQIGFMFSKRHNILIAILAIGWVLFFVLLLQGRAISPSHFFWGWLLKAQDPILSMSVYNDLLEEYRELNREHDVQYYDVFVGDSIIKRFNLVELTSNDNLLNRGIFFDTTLGLLRRLDDNINNINVKNLFIMIGYNDLRYRNDDEIINNIMAIVDKAKSKNTFILSVLPVPERRRADNYRIDQINEKLRSNSMAGSHGYIFIDLNTKFKNQKGGVRSDLTRDGVHPNFEGYKLIFSLVKEYL